MRKIIDTFLSLERFTQRYKDTFPKDRIEKVIYDGMNKIIKEHNDRMTTYALWSRSTGIAVILEWRRDKENRQDKRNHAIIITLPPLKKSFQDLKTTKPTDVKIIVESMIRDRIKLKEEKSDYLKRVKINSLTLWFEDGKMYDSGISHFIEVA
jgi:hypothetical protein